MKFFKADYTHLFYELPSNKFPYNPPSYTCVKEFVNSFPKETIPEIVAEPKRTDPEWQPEKPYPVIQDDSKAVS